MASLKDIAEKVGVSVSVVSRVLRNRMGRTRVRPAVADAIRRTAAEIGYVPNPSAVALSHGRQNSLGVFLHRVGVAGSGIVESTIDGISLAARARHQRLITAFFSTAEEFDEISDVVRRGFVDGLLLAGRMHVELAPRIRALRDGGLPVVTMYHAPVFPDVPNVGLDQHALGRMAAAHLIERGCRRIAMALPTPQPPMPHQAIGRRADGYREALAAARIEVDPTLLLDLAGALDYDSGIRAAAALLDAGIAFDGFFAQSDAQALAVANELAYRGRRVPEDVKLVGVDDAPLCRMARVPLSSISQRYIERARRAVELLHDAIQGRPVETVTMAPILFPRESSRAG